MLFQVNAEKTFFCNCRRGINAVGAEVIAHAHHRKTCAVGRGCLQFHDTDRQVAVARAEHFQIALMDVARSEGQPFLGTTFSAPDEDEEWVARSHEGHNSKNNPKNMMIPFFIVGVVCVTHNDKLMQR